ncbi:FCD domain-containing protein, partial [Nitratireductor sp. GZWM139]|uniref:FCD domain-containing protein n=1 Tax=Nitratireductor sp. GZWM139 TaxID=2950541 RepID=UPI0024BDC948
RTDIVALELLSGSSKPVGNQRLVEALLENGIVVAEATAGRILRSLVSRGFARTLGKRGRIATEAGLKQLKELLEERRKSERSARLVALADVADIDALLEMLHVRRAIEPEAARLATERADADDIAGMTRLACAHCAAATTGEEWLPPAVSFHRHLVLASQNQFLIEVGLMAIEQTDSYLLDKISLDPRYAKITAEEIDRDARAFATDHERMAEAIRMRDQDGAERETRRHIDKLLANVQRFKAILQSPAASNGYPPGRGSVATIR